MATLSAAPVGEVRRFELPFTATATALTNPELGLVSVAQRRGQHAAYRMDVTLLDAPDHRLIRAGIWLAHRIVDGWGEWYLAAPGWTPLLPTERIEQMGHADLPESLANLVRPFRRGATLGPVAALTCERIEYVLRGRTPEPLAVLRNEAVTVRRGGVATARYREVTVTGSPTLGTEQLQWLTDALLAVGATRVDSFPSIATRLGAPATGLTDLPEPESWGRRSALEDTVSAIFAGSLLDLTRADLACRTGRRNAGRKLVKRLRRVTHQVGALAPVLDERWASELRTDLLWITNSLRRDQDRRSPDRTDADQPEATEPDLAQLNGERYLGMLDRLAQAVRSPKLGDSSRLPTGTVMKKLRRDAAAALAAACERLTVAVPAGASPAEQRYAQRRVDTRWAGSLTAAEHLLDVIELQPEKSKQDKQLRRWLRAALALLEQCVGLDPEQRWAEVEDLTAAEAFDAGREFERAWAAQLSARQQFLTRWRSEGRRWVGEPAESS